MTIHDTFISCKNESDIHLIHSLYTPRQNSDVLFWFLSTLIFSIIFFTPLWSVILFYLHWPIVIIYVTARFIGKQLGFKLDDDDPLRPLRLFFGNCWALLGQNWHGYTIEGEENIPRKGPAIFVAYHGAFALDLYYFWATYMTKNNGKVIHPVVHRSFANLKGWDVFCKIVNIIPGTQASCVNCLRKGNLILLAPGGSHEALLSDQKTYKLLWQNKTGFARVAINAQATIVPMFTANIREAYRVPIHLKPIFAYLRSKIPYPIPPVYGGFPVKLTTYLGKPIPYDSSLTPEELSCKVAIAMEDLIRKHQRIPGCVWSAISDRFPIKKSA